MTLVPRPCAVHIIHHISCKEAYVEAKSWHGRVADQGEPKIPVAWAWEFWLYFILLATIMLTIKDEHMV